MYNFIILILFLAFSNAQSFVTGDMGMRFPSIDEAINNCSTRSSEAQKIECFTSLRETYNRDRQIYWVRYIHAVPLVMREMLNEDCPVARARTEAAQVRNEFRAFRCMRSRLQSSTYRYAGAQEATTNLDNFLRATAGLGRSLYECQELSDDDSACGTISNLTNPNDIPGPETALTGEAVSGESVSGESAEGSQFSDGDANTLPTECNYLLGSSGAINHDIVICPREADGTPIPRSMQEGLGRITVATWIDHLRREAMKKVMDRIREEFGNDTIYHNFREGRCLGVRPLQLHPNCRNPDVLSMINERACAPLDESVMLNRRRHERSREFAKVERAEAQRAQAILENAREEANSLASDEEMATMSMPPFDHHDQANRSSFIESQLQAQARIPHRQRQLASYREQLNAIQALYPQLFVENAAETADENTILGSFSRMLGTDRTQPGRDQFPISSHLRLIANATDDQLDIVSDQNARARTLMLDNAWESLNALCDENTVSTEDLVLNEALVNSALADPSIDRQFGNLQRQCLAPSLDESRQTRAGYKVAALISCGIVAAGIGVATGGLGFVTGLGCGMLSVGVAAADYARVSERYAWVSQCRAIMSIDESLCTSGQYLAARSEFRDAWDNLVIESTSLAVFDVALGGIGDLLGALPPESIRNFTRRLRGIDRNSVNAAEEINAVLDAIRAEAALADEAGEVVADSLRIAPVSDLHIGTPSFVRPSQLPGVTSLEYGPRFDLSSITRADPRSVSSTRAEDETIGRLFLRNAVERFRRYTPQEIAAHNLSVRQFVSASGLPIEVLPPNSGIALWDESRRILEFNPGHNEAPSAIRITGRRPASRVLGQRSPTTTAIYHPDFDRLVEELNQMGDGVSVYIDSSLPLQSGQNSYGAFFRSTPPPSIGISPNGPFHLFLHEAQHARFHHTVGSEWAEIERLATMSPQDITRVAAEDPNLAERLERYRTHPDFREAFAMAQDGHVYGGIDETLATQVQARALIEAGYATHSSSVLEAQIYGLQQQVANLEIISRSTRTMTEANTRALEIARRELAMKQNIFRLVEASTAAIAVGAGISLGAFGLGAAAIAGYTIYHNSERGNYAIVRPDGKMQIVTADEVSKLFPQKELEQMRTVEY